MLLVRWVAENIDQSVVAVNSSTILWWAGTLACRAVWILRVCFAREDLFDRDAVLPTVAEVILIQENITNRHEAVESCVTLIEVIVHQFKFDIGVADIVDGELVQMGVSPSHSGLEDSVKLVEHHIAIYLDAPP